LFRIKIACIRAQEQRDHQRAPDSGATMRARRSHHHVDMRVKAIGLLSGIP